MTARRYCTFHVEDLLFGIEIERVQEVLHDEPVTPVPLAPASVAGLHNLRGQIATAVDARTRLGLAPREPGPTTNIVVRADDELIGFIVDAEGEIVEVDDAVVDDVPETVGATIRSFTTGAYQVAGTLLLVLDPDQTLAVASS